MTVYAFPWTPDEHDAIVARRRRNATDDPMRGAVRDDDGDFDAHTVLDGYVAEHRRGRTS